MKPNVGDKVFIKVDLKKNLDPNRVCTQAMHRIIREGKVKTVRFVGDNFVFLVGDEDNWHWDFGWLFPADSDFEGNI